MSAQARPTNTRDAMLAGVILVVIGAAAMISTLWPDLDRYLPLVVGLGLLAVFAISRWYLALVFGALLTALGTGLLLSGLWPRADFDGPASVLGLGTGFVAVWLIGRLLALKEHHWWPLIPGGILLTVGTSLALEKMALLSGRALELVGPVVLLGLGMVIIAAAMMRGRGQAGSAAG
jgi:hypothetical protein